MPGTRGRRAAGMRGIAILWRFPHFHPRFRLLRPNDEKRVSEDLSWFAWLNSSPHRGCMTDAQTLIAEAYSAFNQRNIDAVLALMSESVNWPKASEGGR